MGMNLKSKDIIGMFKATLAFLNGYGVVNFTVKELPYIFLNNPTNNPLPYLCFKVKGQLNRIDMHSALDLKYKNYSRSRKNGFKRGEKNNLVVEETNDFTLFWNDILIPNLDKKHEVKPVHTLAEIELLKSKFPNQVRQFNV